MENKVLYLIVEISQLLKNQQCTYSEAKEILQSLIDEFTQQQEELEYATYDDFFANRKTYHANNDVVKALNHVKEFC